MYVFGCGGMRNGCKGARCQAHSRETRLVQRRKSLSKGEMEIARVLWEIGPATVRQVHDVTSASREVDFATVQTYLRRLESKGYATSKLEGRTRIYAAKTKPRTVIRDTVDDLVNRLFGGRAMMLVRHLIEDGDMDPEQVAELRQLIDDLDTKQTNQAIETKGPSHEGK